MNTCGNCGWGTKSQEFSGMSKCPITKQIHRNDDSCPAHKPIIPAAAQSFVICNGRVKVWAAEEKIKTYASDIDVCRNCDFCMCIDYNEVTCSCENAKCGNGKHYRIVAVEMVNKEN